ncbi:MAG: hybrid sensor histidine kinase/response regulator transcription factor [Phocaeicola sp.]|uniref:hybrid sensor histidine kinase/response regulator transcription factor n=1 Tax=Phocaeicola TaxID=909656 RepID=UPI00234FB0C7|nr:hybrid sensor histidine kinase/response regulator transcription factor [Phocaeicola oris]MCE2617641.1 response regulator [Phocaeicola oris]
MKKLILIIMALTMSCVLMIASTDFRFRHFSVENGLSSNTIRAIIQDKYGFIWFGSEYGLNRYDGINIKVYKSNPQGQNEYISALYDTGDRIWVGTDKGVLIYDYETEYLKAFNVTTSREISPNTTVSCFMEDKDGNLWFSTIGQGVFKYNTNKYYLEQYEFPEANNKVAAIMVDADNQIWAVTNWGGAGLTKLNKAENKFEPFQLIYETNEQHSNSLALLEDTERMLWLGTWECGLQKVDRYTRKVTTYLHPSTGQGVSHIHSLMEYDSHRLLIGSDDGLLLFNTLTGEHRLFAEDKTEPHSISNRFVYPIVKDREGGVWIGTYYGGVNYISPNTGQFESFAHSRFSNSVNGTVIGRFCEDKSGHIWIASDDGGLNCYMPEEQRFVYYSASGKENSLSYHNVHALCMDDDNLWIGTYTGGVNVLNLRTGLFKVYLSYRDNPSTLDGTSSYAIFRDRKKNIWVASMSGVNLYNRETDNFTRVKDLGSLTIDIDQDTNGNIWFSTQEKGLFKYNPDKQTWKNYVHNSLPGSLLSDQVNCILIDSDGNMWIGTMNGLCRYDVKHDAFEAVPLNIPNNNICGIVEEQRILWLTTAKGLVRYVPGEGAQVFSVSDGLQSEQFLPNAVLKASDGKIYIGSVNGFNAFYPYQIKINQVLPPVVITGLEIFNKEVRVGDRLLSKNLNAIRELELSYKENVLSLLYASLSYCTPEKNQYAYKLEGFDKEWNHVGAQNKATYTNLPAGNYVFRVRATNNNGIWSDKEATLKIIIHPPFYWSMAAKVFYFILACFILVFSIRFLLKRTEKKHLEEINRLNVTKEKEVHEAKIKFFTMIAHEIRTPVSLIIGPLEKIMKLTDPIPMKVRNDLNIIDRNSQRLLFLVNQLLDFRKVEQEGMAIRFAWQNIRQLMEAVCERFRPFISHHGVRLDVEYPAADFIAMVDSEAITKLISNLLTNANKYTKDRVLLSCTIQSEQHTFVIRVTDNGIGISKEEQENIFKPFYQAVDNKPGTGIGLNIVKSIVEAHNGCIEVESDVNKGASFIVTLPIEQSKAEAGNGSSDILNPAIPEDILSERLPVVIAPKDRPVMLIVDDNEEMRYFLSNSFAEQYIIVTAEDGVDALEKMKENEVTLIVSDWMMPRMDGIELCRKIRADQTISHIPFILLTAKTDMDSKVEGLDCGADAYIEKPFSVQYLEACIKNLLDLRNLLRNKFSKMPMVPLASVANNTTDNKFLTRINEVIEQNFSNPELSVDFLAEQLCISRSGLFAKIKTLTDVTPNELIQIVRLKKAAALLMENQYRINEICYMVGFNSPSYFAKCFQKQFGMKPSEFINEKEA